MCLCSCDFFFFQAEDGIRDAQESRGLGDVYKRQGSIVSFSAMAVSGREISYELDTFEIMLYRSIIGLSLIHI